MTPVTHAGPPARPPSQPVAPVPPVLIGNDVLQLVSTAMHVDPMAVYREYLQNAADAIDSAHTTGTLPRSEPGRVDITVDQTTRTVRIRDNGSGLPASEFPLRMTALGASPKRGTVARGFRGVGRLAGLAYSRELVFRSRTPGDTTVSEFRWDCRLLKRTMNATSPNLGLAALIKTATHLRRIPATALPQRFFEVEMRGVARLRNDVLLSPTAISAYLAQVAPVPFSPQFSLASSILNGLAPHIRPTQLHIRLNDAAEPLYRPHRDILTLDGKSDLAFRTLDVVTVPAVDRGLAAVGWVLHHDYDGAVPTATGVKGLRVRIANMQVGGPTLFQDLFPETRFNGWSVGEIHILDSRILPNARRDDFEQSVHLTNLLNHLAPTARDLAHRCRTNSARRNCLRQFELHAQSVQELLSILAQRSLPAAKARELLSSATKALHQMTKLAGRPTVAAHAIALRKRIHTLQEDLAQHTDQPQPYSPLMGLPPDQRQSYERFFSLVYECSTNRNAAKALIDRILLRIG